MLSRTGDSLVRVEDVHLLTGETSFVANAVPPDSAVAHFVTSSIAHARLVSIDTQAAEEAPAREVLAARAAARNLQTAVTASARPPLVLETSPADALVHPSPS